MQAHGYGLLSAPFWVSDLHWGVQCPQVSPGDLLVLTTHHCTFHYGNCPAGFIIYFTYGIWNSVEGKNAEAACATVEKPLHHPGPDLSSEAAAI